MEKSRGNSVNRRRFLKGTALGAAALVAQPGSAQSTQVQTPRVGTAPSPSARTLAADTGPVSTNVEVLTEDHPGSDFMLDVLKSVGFEYISCNPASSFRGLHESIINYGGNQAPEILTCCHEETSVALADGYARVAGKPMAVMAHGTVGLQHAAMTIYNAFVCRTPVYIILGNSLDAAERRPGVEWNHSAQDAAEMVRDYIKWDDTPISLTHFAESAVRAYTIAMTPPRGPVILTLDVDLQEQGIRDPSQLRIPRLNTTTPPAGDPTALVEAARMLVAADNPVILGGQAVRTEAGMNLLVELAETLQAPVEGGKMPSRHALRGGGNVRQADVILGLEVSDLWGVVNNFRDQQERAASSIVQDGTKLISISVDHLNLKSNYQNFQRYTELDLAIAADVEVTLPSLIEECRRLITEGRRRELDERGRRLAASHQRALEQARVSATYGWNASPISNSRLHAELWEVIRNRDWASVGGRTGRLWDIDKHYQTLGGGGAGAMGSGLPIAIGAALAHRPHGRFCVRIQGDGDFMYVPGALWTAAHHRIPLLTVMWNNRAYWQEVMHITRMSLRHQRGGGDRLDANSGIGTRIHDPNVDYATVARGMGVYGEGPITNPSDLGPALRRAAEVVAAGEPALVDVVTQPR